MESLICDLQDVTVLVGVGLNALFGWWWADPMAAFALIPFLLREGWEAFHPDDE
jgi:divalent metal cation (Fe/Co/Zn/Cd) transporter